MNCGYYVPDNSLHHPSGKIILPFNSISFIWKQNFFKIKTLNGKEENNTLSKPFTIVGIHESKELNCKVPWYMY